MEIYIHLIKLQYAHHAKAGAFLPTRSRGPARNQWENKKWQDLK